MKIEIHRRLLKEMEMEMRAKEEVDIAMDITNPIVPLSYCLHDSFLHSHCSSCFSPLPSPPHHHHLSSLFYCSNQCFSSDSSLHFSSAENHLLLLSHLPDETSDIRAALRFLQSQRLTSHSGRIAGLLINRGKFMSQDDELSEKIRIGARAMAAAMMMQRGCEELDEAVFEDAMAALCLVLTNAVEVHDNSGHTIGIAVYDPNFCWINHSCSPNSIYRFVFCSPDSPPLPSGQHNLRIAPFARNSQGLKTEIDSELYCSSSELAKGMQNYGPRIIVRSIKRIRKGEEVTVTYTDLLQPKAMRQSELWSRYRFICCCTRCTASPLTCVDHTLQEISTVSLDSTAMCSSYKFYGDEAARILTEYIDDVISEYLSIGNPESCCEKLENILTQGLKVQLEGSEGKPHFTFKLHPLNHLSLNAYTTLASAYRVRAFDLSSLYSETDENHLEGFDLSRTSAAYSLLLAGATHHLFNFEPSLVASLVNFWIGAGESLLSLSRSSGRSELVKQGLVDSDLSSFANFKCSKCSLMTRFIACKSNGQVKSADFEDLSSEFLQCVTDISRRVWSFLVYGCQLLRLFKDPVNFSWLVATKNSSNDMGSSSYESEGSIGIREDQGDTDQGREHIFQLAVHCLVYGGFLAIICYGNPSQMTCPVHNIVDHGGNFIDSVR